MASNGDKSGHVSGTAAPPRRSESAVSFGSPADDSAGNGSSNGNGGNVRTPVPAGGAKSSGNNNNSGGGLTPVAGGLIAGAYDTPKNSSAGGKTPSRTPAGTSKTPSRTPGTGLPPSRRASSSAASTPAVSISASSSSAANTPAAGGGAQQQPKTPKFTPSHNTSTPIASIKRPRASLGGCRSTSKTMVHQGAGGKQRVGPGPNSTRNLGETTTTSTVTTTTTTTTRSTSVSLGTGIMTPPTGGGVSNASAEPEGSVSSKSSTSTSTDSLKENGGDDGDALGKKIGGSDTFASPMPNRSRTTVLANDNSSPDGRVATPVNLSSPMAKSAGVDDTAIAPPTPGLPMSPMHPAKPMKAHSPDTHHHHAHDGGDEQREMGPDGQWKISNIFSPVMNFLGGTKEEGDEDSGAAAGQHAADVAIEQEEAPQGPGVGVGGVGADLDAEAAAVEGLVHLNDPVPAAAARNDDAEDTNDESGYATAEEDVDADGDVAMEDVDGSQSYHVHMHEETTTTTTTTYNRNSPNGHDAVVQEYSFDSSVTDVDVDVEPIPDADMVFPVVFNGVEYSVNVRKRPYLEEFLQRVHGKFEVIVFTASQQVYADELLDRIDPERKYIKHRMFREACLAVEGNYLKDLNVCQRDMKKMVLVDNSPHAFGYQVDNGIPIESWFDDPSDRELLKLERFLRTLHDVPDVRELVRKEFGSWQKIREA